MPLQLGRKAKQTDPRTIRYNAVRDDAAWAGLPESWSWNTDHGSVVPTPVFLNDQIGDCVEAESAHYILRAEYEETGVAPKITDAEVRAAYFDETGGQDEGLVILDHLKLWRNTGLLLGGERYKIKAFVDVTPQDEAEMKEAMIVSLGLNIGVDLPLSAADQLNAGQPWDLSIGPRSAAGSWGGHCVLVVGYDAFGVTLVTWGAYQRASWAWIRAYCDEAYAVLDALDTDGIRAGAMAMALANI